MHAFAKGQLKFKGKQQAATVHTNNTGALKKAELYWHAGTLQLGLFEPNNLSW